MPGWKRSELYQIYRPEIVSLARRLASSRPVNWLSSLLRLRVSTRFCPPIFAFGPGTYLRNFEITLDNSGAGIRLLGNGWPVEGSRIAGCPEAGSRFALASPARLPFS